MVYIDNGKLVTRLYDKRDDFNFPILDFPFLTSTIPLAPTYAVYVSQLVHYARAYFRYQEIFERGKLRASKVLSQGCHGGITVKTSIGNMTSLQVAVSELIL